MRYRFRKFARRNRSVLAVAGLIVCFLLLLGSSIGYMVGDRATRLAKAELNVAEALAGARTGIEAGDLALAARRVAEAQGHLGIERERLGDAAAEVDRVHEEIETRQADENRFSRFLKLASDGQDKMGYSENLGGDSLAKEALELYGALGADDWVACLDESSLTADKKEQIREAAYVTFVSLADFGVRWKHKDPKTAQRSHDLLRRAEAFHRPTRAFYFVRGRCYKLQGNTAAFEEEVKRYEASEARTAWDHYLPGHTAGWEGDLPEAIRSYQAALRIQPNHYNSLFFLAMRLATDKINRRPEAIQLFTGCIALRPNHIGAYICRAQRHEESGQIAEAEADFSSAIEVATDDGDKLAAYSYRHEYWERRGNVEKSRIDLERQIVHGKKAIELNANASTLHSYLGDALRMSGLVDEAIACYRKAVELDPNHPKHHSFLGDALSMSGLMDEAIACYRKAIELDPKDVIFHNNLGTALFSKGQWAEAIPCFRKAIELDPGGSRYHNDLGLALSRSGLVDEAIACYHKAIELDPKAAIPHNGLGQAFGKKGLTDEAIACYRKAVELDPKNFVSHRGLGFALKIKGLVDEAIASARKAVELEPNNAVSHWLLGAALQTKAFLVEQKGLMDEAIACFRKAIELDPKYANAHNDLGVALHDKGLWDEAATCYRKTTELEPKQGLFHCNLAILLANCPDSKYRDLQQAMTLANRSIELSPDDAGPWAALGTVHYRLGDFKAALAALDKGQALRNPPYFLSFFLAITHWQLGAKDQALSWHQKGVDRMESKDSKRRNDSRLNSLRAEAAALLQIADEQRIDAETKVTQ